MRKIILLLLVFFIVSLFADWNPGDPHKMGGNGPQLPDPNGYDVDFILNYIGDDWTCGESGPIDQIHFWISFEGDNTGNYTLADFGNLTIQIYSDDPVGDDPGIVNLPEENGEDIDNVYSKPRHILWEGVAPWEIIMTPAEPGLQGWYSPWEPSIDEDNHDFYYQINLNNITGQVVGQDFLGDPENIITETDAYYQYVGTTYWLMIYVADPPTSPIGWKTSLNHWQDNAVFFDFADVDPNEIWIPLNQHPLDPILFDGTNYQEFIDLAFVISGTEATLPVELSSFTISQTAQDFAQLAWTTASETALSGFNLYKSEENNPDQSQRINTEIIDAVGSSSTETDYTFTDEFVEAEIEYYYWLESLDLDGSTELFGPYEFYFEKDDEEEVEAPEITLLKNAYPNPFNPITNLDYQIKKDSQVNLSIYNIKGELVRTIFNGAQSAGEYHEVWNGKDNHGNMAASGIYFYKLSTDHKIITKKAILMK